MKKRGIYRFEFSPSVPLTDDQIRAIKEQAFVLATPQLGKALHLVHYEVKIVATVWLGKGFLVKPLERSRRR